LATSSAEMTRTRSETSVGSPVSRAACRSMSLGGARRTRRAERRPSAQNRPGTQSVRSAPTILLARTGSSALVRRQRSAGRNHEWQWSRRLLG
jgi:hypothetical protein